MLEGGQSGGGGGGSKMHRQRDEDGFELEAPTFTKKCIHSDQHSTTPSTYIYTNDDSTNFKGEKSLLLCFSQCPPI